MSEHTDLWLNTKTLQGFTAQRGHAWHYAASLQGEESNHYEGAIPREDVYRRLLSWELVRVRPNPTFTVVDDEGTPVGKPMALPDNKFIGMARPPKAFGPDDPGEVFAYFGDKTYATHQYGKWGAEALELLTDGPLQIGSAGLLKGGAVFWLQAQLEETQEVVPGLAFRPYITAATSANGQIATSFFTGAQVVVCDNTLSAAIRDPKAAIIRIRHSSKSLVRMGEVRDALGIIQSVSEDFTRQVNALLDATLTDKQWTRFLEEQAGLVDVKGKRKELLPMHQQWADKKFETFTALTTTDERVSPWAGTAFGAVQLMNTFQHHASEVRGGDDRFGRNMLRHVKGEWDKLDNQTLIRVEAITRKKIAVTA
jgi:phage/plasmid-like protein (TIGR03299 family)